jgi:hypothetical protein
LDIIDAVLGRKLNESEDSSDSNGSADEESKMTMAEAISCCDNHKFYGIKVIYH